MPRRDSRPPSADERPAEPPLRVVRRRYHLHIPGIVYVLTTLLMAVGAINSQNNLLFWAFGVAVTALIVSGALSGSALMGLEISRDPIGQTSAGDPLLVRYRLRNRNRLIPSFGLTIVESEHALRGAAAPTWPGLTSQPRAFVVEIGARRQLVVEASAQALRRGVASFDAITVSTTFPFGLTRKSFMFAGPASVIIQPRRLTLRHDLVQSLIRRGDHAGSSKTFSPTGEDFFALREYRPGDNPRAIAWRATARAGQWLIRTHTAPGPRRLWILIDAAEADGEKAETAISLAASLATAARAQGLIAGVCLPSAGLLVNPRHSPAALRQLLNALATAPWRPHADPPARLPTVADRESVVVIHAAAAGQAAVVPPSASHLFVERLHEYLAPHRPTITSAAPAAPLPTGEGAAA